MLCKLYIEYVWCLNGQTPLHIINDDAYLSMFQAALAISSREGPNTATTADVGRTYSLQEWNAPNISMWQLLRTVLRASAYWGSPCLSVLTPK